MINFTKKAEGTLEVRYKLTFTTVPLHSTTNPEADFEGELSYRTTNHCCIA